MPPTIHVTSFCVGNSINLIHPFLGTSIGSSECVDNTQGWENTTFRQDSFFTRYYKLTIPTDRQPDNERPFVAILGVNATYVNSFLKQLG